MVIFLTAIAAKTAKIAKAIVAKAIAIATGASGAIAKASTLKSSI